MNQDQQIQVNLYAVIGQKDVENGVLRERIAQLEQLAKALDEKVTALEAASQPRPTPPVVLTPPPNGGDTLQAE